MTQRIFLFAIIITFIKTTPAGFFTIILFNSSILFKPVISNSKGIKPIETSLTYDHNKNIYVWTVVNIISEWKGYNDEPYKEIELLEINASNGNIINFFPNGIQGPIH